MESLITEHARSNSSALEPTSSSCECYSVLILRQHTIDYDIVILSDSGFDPPNAFPTFEVCDSVHELSPTDVDFHCRPVDDVGRLGCYDPLDLYGNSFAPMGDLVNRPRLASSFP